MNQTMERHPLSAVWGDMPPDEYADLVESIRNFRDIEVPVIWTLDGMVLDGWHRYRACAEVTAPYQVKQYAGKDPATFVIAKNAHRRHLTPGQRAACVVACHEWAQRGQPKKSEPGSNYSPPATEQHMADEAGVSTKTIQQAKIAQDAGLGEKTRSGELSPKAAAAEARTGDRPDEPKPPTRTQLLEAEVDAARLEIQAKSDEIDQLKMRLKYESAAEDADQQQVFTEMLERNRVLQTSVNEWQVRYNEELRARKWWERQARTLGWKPQ